MDNISILTEDERWLQEYAEEESARWTIKLVFCTLYFLLFLFGTIGNGCVIIMLINVLTQMRGANKLSSGTTHVFIYVLGLSIVDFLVIMHLPLLIFDIIEGQWIFGLVMCKLYWVGESVNKLLSSFLMTVLSWDRFMAVCAPLKSFRYRTNNVAIMVLMACTSMAMVLLYPVLKESTVQIVDKATLLKVPDDSHQGTTTIQKCVFETNTPAFMLYTFAFGFIMPALLISVFYLRVILSLHKKTKGVKLDKVTSAASQRLHKVTKRIVTVVLFYFFCWTPYWTLNIMLQYQIFVSTWSALTLSSVFFAAHLLICFNSAANPVLYALINRELRQQHVAALMKRRKSNQVLKTTFSVDKVQHRGDPPYFGTLRRHTTVFERHSSQSSIDSTMLVALEAAKARCRTSLPQGKLNVTFNGFCSFMIPKTSPHSHMDNMETLIKPSFSQPSISTATSSVNREESMIIDGHVHPSDAFL
ncbi:unnamed protein product [Bursaphelenchus okinawaensis]|uniref:G-protein coupled receptors family 1 profile domain-containing protein n=1 Tax=Bursaphelenchus okinawaensis TaxID=465554 RepID=A0A811KZ43_9BILA|nr:unnamed protein product [Bursaphelenchus okinawaensis]CAG9113276.1 unnamed protein product [Bursaphelenchus okinawaensis]